MREGRYDMAVREATLRARIAVDVRSRAASFLQTYTTSAAADKWDRWVRDTIALSRRPGTTSSSSTSSSTSAISINPAGSCAPMRSIWAGPIRDKQRSGDRATPEGMYRVVQKRARGQTTYYKALLINYPNDEDRAEFAMAKRRGWVSRGPPSVVSSRSTVRAAATRTGPSGAWRSPIGTWTSSSASSTSERP
jgi:hypothetical protein